MFKFFWIRASALYSLILLPTLFQPIGLDYSIFLLGGKTIINGGKPFVDFIDIKPSGVYYFFSIVYTIFGTNPICHQCFFLIIHLLSGILLAYLFLKNNFGELESLLAPVPMLIIIASYDFNNRMQIENFFTLLTISIIYLLHNNKSARSFSHENLEQNFRWFIIGGIAGFLFTLKYTFGIALFFPLLYMLQKREQKIFKPFYLVSLTFGFFLVTTIIFFPTFYNKETWDGFKRIITYLNYYFDVQTNTDVGFVAYALKNISNFFGEKFSVLASIFFFFGLWKLYTRGNDTNYDSRLLNFLLSAALLVLFSILIESKFFEYHFIRLLPLVSPFVSIGAIDILKTIKSKPSQYRGTIIFVLFLAATFLSPLPFYIQKSIPLVFFIINKQKYENFYERDLPTYHHRQQNQIANFLNSRISEKDTIYTISISSPQLNLKLKTKVTPRFPLSCYYLSTYKVPETWHKWLVNDLLHSKYLIFQNDDRNWIFGHSKSSLEAFFENPTFFHILKNNFDLIYETKNYKIFERKK
ncbi:MAG: glycosyltransferase family 39 protein [Candidatus Kapaibacteriales bacterium]